MITGPNNLKRRLATRLMSSARLRRVANRLCLEALAREPDATREDRIRNWRAFEPFYALTRSRLVDNPMWRYGPKFVHATALKSFSHVERHGSLQGKRILEIGCGEHHPLGTVTALYLNGAASCTATDRQPTDERRAAVALFDLLVDCLAFPDEWHWSGARDDFLSRIHEFDLKALARGDLLAGVATAPIRHVVTDLNQPTIAPGTIDVMLSRAVLEHLVDFERANRMLYSLLATGGLAYHLIDLVDHRAYGASSGFHWWSFLEEDDQWTGGGRYNRLRYGDYLAHFEKAGFQILEAAPADTARMPAGFRQKLAGRFASMTDDELAIIRMECVLRKAEGQAVARRERAVPHTPPATALPSGAK